MPNKYNVTIKYKFELFLQNSIYLSQSVLPNEFMSLMNGLFYRNKEILFGYMTVSAVMYLKGFSTSS